jgi:hypothetical protein
MAQLADAAREQAKTFMLEAPDLESEYEMQLERDVETVFGDGEPKAKPEVKETTAAEDWDNLKPDHSAQEPQEAAPEVKAEGNLMDMDFCR